MKFSFASALVVTLAAEATVASSWFSKAAYNKWHETELERWLSDHDVPYPTPADRKDLENLVKTNWNAAVESPYAGWTSEQLQKYMSDRGYEVKKETAKNKDSLVSQVKGSWHDTEGSATTAYGDIKAWVFDSWTESSLKSFCDKHGIPVPQPRKRDTLLKTVRENYQNVANKAGETASYPGNWLYDSWSDSDLKAWLDERGIPAPQTGKRDKLIASVRRNAYLASKDADSYVSSASKSASGAQQTLSDAVFDAWSDSEIKSWADKNGIRVPQGSNRNELLAIARKNVAKLTGDNVSGSVVSAYGAATSSAGNEYAKASQHASSQGNNLLAQASSYANHYYTEAQIALGMKTNYASSASASAASISKSAASAYSSVSAKAEL